MKRAKRKRLRAAARFRKRPFSDRAFKWRAMARGELGCIVEAIELEMLRLFMGPNWHLLHGQKAMLDWVRRGQRVLCHPGPAPPMPPTPMFAGSILTSPNSLNLMVIEDDIEDEDAQ